MTENSMSGGVVCLNVGLLCSTTSRLLDRSTRRGQVATVVRGALDGLSIAAYGAALASLVPLLTRRAQPAVRQGLLRLGRKQAPAYAIWR
jgi:hypothetical protein